MTWSLLAGDCLEVLPTLEPCSIGAVVCDPPYGLGFMGRAWDTFDADAVALRAARKARKGTAIPEGSGELNAAGYVEYDCSPRGLRGFQSWCEQWGREALRVLKPGGYLLAFGGQRTYHRLACGLEDAGFEVRDSLHWLFGSGFPKSLNLGDGMGTALKPAHEPIVLARKPLSGTYAANVARWGVGGLDIDGCRVGLNGKAPPTGSGDRRGGAIYAQDEWTRTQMANDGNETSALGRWPTNLLLTHHPDCNGACVPGCPVAVLDAQSGQREAGARPAYRSGMGFSGGSGTADGVRIDMGGGGASRFYPTFRFEADDFAPFLYVAKAARSERERGLRALTKATPGERTGRKEGSAGLDSPRAGAGRTNAGANIHPTVKPVALMRWLVRLVCPPGETVLDNFGGSGTTGVAALAEGRDVILIERAPEYLPIIRRRLEATQPGFALALTAD
jgi:DNA modification methylase